MKLEPDYDEEADDTCMGCLAALTEEEHASWCPYLTAEQRQEIEKPVGAMYEDDIPW